MPTVYKMGLLTKVWILKLEEKKAWKKIEETKRMAEQVMNIRQRNEDDKMAKHALRAHRELEENQKRAMNE